MSNSEKMALLEDRKSKRAYGIDLGTTNSCMSLLNGGLDTVKLKNGRSTMPSCVMWHGETDTFTVGEAAKSQKGAPNVAYSIKRLMGTDKEITLMDGEYSRTFTPIELSAEVLRGLVEQASELHKDIKDIVLTVPARFNNKQIDDTKKAAELIGLNVLKMLKEPTSAAVAYGMDESVDEDELSLVYDLGGGTFDVSLVRISKGGYSKEDEDFLKIYSLTPKDVGLDTSGTSITVIKTHGNTHLGGDDIDIAVLDYVLEEVEKKGFDISLMPESYKGRLQAQCERFKIIGLDNRVADIPISYTPIGCKSSKCEVRTTVQVTNDMLEKAVRKVYVKTRDIINDNLSRTELDGIKHIILVGGSTKSQLLKNLLKRDFHGIPINDKYNPDLLVCLGAGVEASRYTNKSVNVSISDIIPMSIGILANDRVSPVIRRYSRIPLKERRKFTTAEDGQDFISIKIYEGDSSYPQECTYLGDLRVDGIPSRKAGEVLIDVILSIDSDGLLVCQVRVEDIYKDKELVNVLGKTEEEPNQNSLTSNKKAIVRWRAKADSLIASNKESLGDELNALLDELESGNVTLTDVQQWLKANRQYL